MSDEAGPTPTPDAEPSEAPDVEAMRAREAARRTVGDAVLLLEVSADSMYALLSIKPGPQAELDREAVEALLQEAEVSGGLDDEAIDGALARAAGGESVVRAVIARGVPQKDGENARIDFEKRPTGRRSVDASVEDDETVDYREVFAFDNVHSGDIIGRFVPRREGRGGVDVYGRVIPPREGKDLKVVVGQNVEYHEESREYRALVKGHVTWDDRRIEVEPIYRIQKDVDLSQGNIRFVGRVEVMRDVRDDFVVSGDEGVYVGGTAEACHITSGDDVVIDGGVTGKGRARIEARGNVFARFLDETHVVAGGDVVVTREVVNCTVHALGRLIVTEGAVVGGTVVALRGVAVGAIGSDLGVKQRITAGIDYHVAEKLHDIHHEARKLRERQQKLLQTIGPLLERAVKASVVDNNLREEIEELWPRVRDLQKQIRRLETESGEISKDFADEAVERIEVQGQVFAGTTLLAGKCERDVDEAIKGPLVMLPNAEARRVDVESFDGKSRLGEAPPEPEWVRHARG